MTSALHRLVQHFGRAVAAASRADVHQLALALAELGRSLRDLARAIAGRPKLHELGARCQSKADS